MTVSVLPAVMTKLCIVGDYVNITGDDDLDECEDESMEFRGM